MGFQESDIKGYEGFNKFAAALQAEGIDLSSGGPYTLLAPSDSAFEKHMRDSGLPITADILKYHIIPGAVLLDDLTTNQPTLNGAVLTANRKYRKNWLDNAVVGLKSEGPIKSSNWPSDVEFAHGIIHAIDTILIPGAYQRET